MKIVPATTRPRTALKVISIRHRHSTAKAGFLPLTLLAMVSHVAWSQVEVGYRGSLTTAKDVDLNQEFQLGTPTQREGLLEILGVDKIYVHDAATAMPQTTIHVDQMEGTGASLLFLPCGGQGSPFSHLYLLRPAQDLHWRAVDRVHLDCWRESTSYELIHIQGRFGQAILVHHINRGHGSGLVQDNMALFEVQKDHLAKVLDTQEYKFQDQTDRDQTVQQSSTLLAFPDGSLEETRITTGKSSSVQVQHAASALVERRRWYWSQSSQAFVPKGFSIVR